MMQSRKVELISMVAAELVAAKNYSGGPTPEAIKSAVATAVLIIEESTRVVTKMQAEDFKKWAAKRPKYEDG